MNLKMTIQKIKSINSLEIDLPIDKGLYTITGQNGSGKSTVVTCASIVFFNMKMHKYFGITEPDS
jgi:chromosome segregation ATPase